MSHGTRLLSSPIELAQFKKSALSYSGLLRQLARAVADDDENRAKHLTGRILASDAAKLSAVARTIKWGPEAPPISLAELEAIASTLNPYRRVNETIRLYDTEESARRVRLVFDFGPKRRALQAICADILAVRLPAVDFEYLARGRGADRATLRLKETIEKEGYDHVVIVDIQDCFGSVQKGKVAALLPLPTQVVDHVLLVHDDAKLRHSREVSQLTFGWPLSVSTHFHTSIDAAARRGLPPGSLASNLILSRAVLGPLLSATSFSDRLVLHGDDIAIPVKGEGEAQDTLQTLRSIFENTPVGPLTIGRHAIRHVSEWIHFLKYAVRLNPWSSDGSLYAVPSGKSFDRFGDRAAAKYLKGPPETAKGRVSLYRKKWPKAFPLWKPNKQALGLLWDKAFEAREKAELIKKLPPLS